MRNHRLSCWRIFVLCLYSNLWSRSASEKRCLKQVLSYNARMGGQFNFAHNLGKTPKPRTKLGTNLHSYQGIQGYTHMSDCQREDMDNSRESGGLMDQDVLTPSGQTIQRDLANRPCAHVPRAQGPRDRRNVLCYLCVSHTPLCALVSCSSLRLG